MPHTGTVITTISVTDVTNETVDNSANEPANSEEAGAGAAAAGTTLPLRGFAMVLIAVAVMFGLWALYAFTQDNGSEQAAEQTSQTEQQDGEAANQPEPGTVAADTAQQSAEAVAPEEGGQGTDGEETNADDADGANSDADNREGSGDAAAKDASNNGASQSTGSGNAAPAAPLKVNVLNNSLTQGLAADISDRLRADGHELGEVGNFAEDVLPETTVFFPAGNAEGERVARELADEYNGVARENIDTLPDNTQDGVTLVLTEN